MADQRSETDKDALVDKLDASSPLRDPVIREAIRILDLPEGSRGLDAGCGIGSHSLLLADAVGAGGHVTGLDFAPDLVAHAKGLAARSGLRERVGFRQGDVSELPFDDGHFDWAWSVDCVGHVSIGDPQAGLRELARVVRPGGLVALLFYSSQVLLPGYPQLEARLNAKASAMTVLGEGKPPEVHFMRALGWFHAADLKEPTARTVVGTVQAPLDEGTRRALISLFGMLWGERKSRLGEVDRNEYRRLTDPESPDFILVSPDYCAFFTYSIFVGRVV